MTLEVLVIGAVRVLGSLPVLLELAYGRCRLEAAVPNDSPARALADLSGRRLATRHERA